MPTTIRNAATTRPTAEVGNAVPPLLPRFLENAQTRREHAAKLLQVVADAADAGEEPNVGQERKRFYAAPTDSRTLRGLPAIGRSVQGCIRWTQPEQEVVRRSESR
jgi:hypothetical protein